MIISRMPKKSIKERFDRFYFPEPNTGCWLWTGAEISTGYGGMGADGRTKAAHRISYELFVGSIPDGFQIDHLCGVKMCVNPTHLEAVTQSENMRRAIERYKSAPAHRSVPGRLADPAYNSKKTHCKHGHELTGTNVRFHKKKNRPGIARECLACRQVYPKLRRQAQAATHQGHQAAALRPSSD